MTDILPAGMRPVSPQLTRVRLISAAIWIVILTIAAVALSLFNGGGWWWLTLAGVSVLALWLAWLIPAQVRNMAWLETEDELLITKGKLWHKFTVVPYGRIQFVDVTAGPIARAFGLKAVELHTASAGTDAEIKGLDAAEADALRERLTERARERMSGL